MTIWKQKFIPEDCITSLLSSEKFGRQDTYFKSKEIGQELIVNDCPKFRKKILSLIKTYTVI